MRHIIKAKPKKRLILGSLALFLFGLFTSVWAGEFTAFGPQDYLRQSGTPVTVTNNFSVLNPGTEFFLRVYNGGLQDQEAELVSSTVISINGSQVLGPDKFNQNVRFIEIPLSLRSNNIIDVEVRGKPGGLLTTKIVGVDNIAPNIQITAPLDGSLSKINPYTIQLIFNDDISGINTNSFKIYINAVDKTASFNITTTGLSGSASADLLLSEGTNVIEASISDFAGNTSSTSASFTLDTTVPIISNLLPADGSILANTKPTISADFTDNISGIDISSVKIILDGVDVTSSATITSSGFSYALSTNLADGTHSLTVDVKDKAGNPATQAKWSFIIDTEPPQITIEGVTNGSSVNIDVTPIITVTDEHLDTQTITLNGAAFISGTVVSAEGAYTLEVKAKDASGNSATKSVYFTIDKTNPAISITGVSDGEYLNHNVTPVITITDTNLRVEYIELNGNPFTSGTTITEDGMYYLSVKTVDWAGNMATAAIDFTIDKAPPQVTINPVISPTNSPTQVITGSYFKDNIQSVTVNGIYASFNKEAKTYSQEITLVEGDNIINVVATDNFGNTATATAMIKLLSITPPPVVPTGLAATAGDAVVDLSWNANTEPGFAGYNVYRAITSGGPYTKINQVILTQNSYKDTNGLSNGVTYYYVVSAVNSLGNESAYSSEISATPIYTTSIQPEDNSIFLAGATINIEITASSGSENNPLQYQFSIGGAVIQPWSASNTYSWQTVAADTGAVSITCEVRDSRGVIVSKTITYYIINPTVEEILQKVADNYVLVEDKKMDVTITSKFNTEPFGETIYTRHYFRKPDKQRTETFSTEERTDSSMTEIQITVGPDTYLIDPISHAQSHRNILTELNLTLEQLNQMDEIYHLQDFLSAHTIIRKDTSEDLAKGLVMLEATPKVTHNVYSKLGIQIDYFKGLRTKSLTYLRENEQDILKQAIEITELQEISNGAWVPKKQVKTLYFTEGNLVMTSGFTNIYINRGLPDYLFNPEGQ